MNVIAIDGPSGSGKSTIAKEVAKLLNITYIDTGAMFRAIAIILSSNNISVEQLNNDQKYAQDILNNLNFEYGVDEDILIKIDGLDLTQRIREHEVSFLASQYSQFEVVRKFLKDLQRKIGEQKDSILEGRDIGTVIFPKARLKVFLTANSEVRAKRRFDQLILNDSQNAKKYSLSEILKDIELRDEEDSKRVIAPLKKAADAIEIDTSNKTINEICNQIVHLYKDI